MTHAADALGPGDIRAVRARLALPCRYCGQPVTPGDLVHFHDHRVVSHVACDLRARRAAR
jgi:hypothetical protein